MENQEVIYCADDEYMKEYFCDTCDKTIKKESKTDHFKSESHLYSSERIAIRYSLLKQDISKIEDVLKQLIEEHEKKIRYFSISCEIIREGSSDLVLKTNNFCILISDYNTLKEIINHNKNEILRKDVFFHHFFRLTPYDFYLKLPKSMLQGMLLKKVHSHKIIKN